MQNQVRDRFGGLDLDATRNDYALTGQEDAAETLVAALEDGRPPQKGRRLH